MVLFAVGTGQCEPLYPPFTSWFHFVSQWPCPEGVGPLAFFYFFYFFVLEWLPPSLPLLRSGAYANGIHVCPITLMFFSNGGSACSWPTLSASAQAANPRLTSMETTMCVACATTSPTGTTLFRTQSPAASRHIISSGQEAYSGHATFLCPCV